MRNVPAAVILSLFATGIFAQAGGSGLRGEWREPGGSVIRVEPCGDKLCATLVKITDQAPPRTDVHNPDARARIRPLCLLVIGRNFNAENDSHADGGTLYDPKSGRTYHGEMKAEGDRLVLRGYVGLKLFGRSETWTRTRAASTCNAR